MTQKFYHHSYPWLPALVFLWHQDPGLCSGQKLPFLFSLQTQAGACHLGVCCRLQSLQSLSTLCQGATLVDPFTPALPLIAGVLCHLGTLHLDSWAAAIFVLLICIFPPDWLVDVVE